MHAYFVLLSRVFVDETRTVHRIFVKFGGKGRWTRNFCAVSNRHVDNLLCGTVYDFRIIGPHLDPKALNYFFFSMFRCQRACETSKQRGPSLSPEPRRLLPLFQNFCYDACADGFSALSDRKALFFFERDRNNKFYCEFYRISRHNHFNAFGKSYFTRHVRCPDIKLGFIPAEKRRVAPAFFL